MAKPVTAEGYPTGYPTKRPLIFPPKLLLLIVVTLAVVAGASFYIGYTTTQPTKPAPGPPPSEGPVLPTPVADTPSPQEQEYPTPVIKKASDVRMVPIVGPLDTSPAVNLTDLERYSNTPGLILKDEPLPRVIRIFERQEIYLTNIVFDENRFAADVENRHTVNMGGFNELIFDIFVKAEFEGEVVNTTGWTSIVWYISPKDPNYRYGSGHTNPILIPPGKKIHVEVKYDLPAEKRLKTANPDYDLVIRYIDIYGIRPLFK